jgi:hypothetical protein
VVLVPYYKSVSEALYEGFKAIKSGLDALKNGLEALKSGFEALKNGFETQKNGFAMCRKRCSAGSCTQRIIFNKENPF